ncbi:arylesterase [Aminobacter carboxidus]|uniref:Acyl-CoA thioesterase-1 n=1 Tax=Aminobacter carboxidus TaxID=376165 RepID=A0A8E2BDH1_9HYPH|nr:MULTISPECIES: arylesterase [Aminobacter carboxidus group]MBB6465805.1 acyl-CoA thioesterase-1 [Aminobacter lissarensis]MBE1204457.1 arylesterase [Aminobacter carboxidus]
MALKHLIFAIFAASLAFFTTIAPVRAEPLKIVGFGDSLMAGYGLNPGESFPEKLEKALRNNGHDVVITNAGVSGDTTSGGLSRLDWSIPDGTQLVILELGANDMLRGIDPALVEQNLDKMLARLKERKIEVLLAGMVAAPNLGHAYAEQFGTIYPKLAEKYGATLYPFFLDGVAGDPKLLLEDGMHPTAQGIDRMVEKALPTVEKVIAGK